MGDRENERQSYRLLFPVTEQPVFVVGGTTYQVLDCSEHGVRYIVPGGELPAMGSQVRGMLRFRPGTREEEKVDVQGTVVRHAADNQAAIKLGRPIPYALLMGEQRRLRAKYPDWR